VENTLVLSQLLAKDKTYLPSISYTPESKKNKFNFSEITREDIRRVFNVQLSFSDKMKNELSEITRKSILYDRMIQSEKINRSEALAWLVGNEKEYVRLTSGVNEKENIATMQALSSKAAGAAPAGEMPIVGGAGSALGGLDV